MQASSEKERRLGKKGRENNTLLFLLLQEISRKFPQFLREGKTYTYTCVLLRYFHEDSEAIFRLLFLTLLFDDGNDVVLPMQLARLCKYKSTEIKADRGC